jgi:hypothetical protein
MSSSNSNAFNIGRVYDALEGRNRIINGDCRIAQRGTSVSVTATGATTYGGPDRYAGVISTSAGGAFTQSASNMSFGGITGRPSILQTVTTAATSIASGNYWYGIIQLIEGTNCFDIAFSPISISFWFQSNVTGTFSVSLRDSTPSQSYVTTFNYTTAGTPQKVIVNIPQPTVALTIPNTNAIGLFLAIGSQNTGTFQTSTLNAWQSGNFFTASGAVSWSNTINNYIEVTELQLEQGSVASTFEREPYSSLLNKCQRYFFSGRVFIGPSASYIALPVPMRTAMGSATIGGTGAGFTQDDTNPTTGLICHQTSGSGQSITVSTEF